MINIETAVAVSVVAVCAAYFVGFVRGVATIRFSMCTIHSKDTNECIAVVRKNGNRISEVIWEKLDATRTPKG